MRTQLAIERAGLVTLHLQPARRSSIPTINCLRRVAGDAAVVVALEQRRLGHEELSSKSGSVRLKPTCCGAFGLDSRLGHPWAESSIDVKWTAKSSRSRAAVSDSLESKSERREGRSIG